MSKHRRPTRRAENQTFGVAFSVILTSLRAFSSFGLLSSTVSLDCCFNFRSIAVTVEVTKEQLEVAHIHLGHTHSHLGAVQDNHSLALPAKKCFSSAGHNIKSTAAPVFV